MKNDTDHFDYQGRVIEFMEASGQVVNTTPHSMTTDLADLRYRLFQEEVLELREAILQQDKVEQLDAIVDILYILLGTGATIGDNLNPEIRAAIDWCIHTRKGRSTVDVLSLLESAHVLDLQNSIQNTIILAFDMGFKGEQIQKAFQLVHSNNMSKFCKSVKEAIASVQEYSIQGVEAFWQRRGDIYVILRKEDGKVLKGINYKKVELKELV